MLSKEVTAVSFILLPHHTYNETICYLSIFPQPQSVGLPVEKKSPIAPNLFDTSGWRAGSTLTFFIKAKCVKVHVLHQGTLWFVPLPPNTGSHRPIQKRQETTLQFLAKKTKGPDSFESQE